MNKYEKAIQFLQDALDTAAQWDNDYRVNQVGISEINTAMKALEKQIPKRLSVVDELYHCPVCSEKDAILQGDNYCFNCGQALDWSDTE